MTRLRPKRASAGGALFSARLKKVMRGGNLTVADLARWLDRPHATVRCWTLGTEPSGAPLDVEHAHQMLALLERMIARRIAFPLPRLSAAERARKLAEVRAKVMQA
jgi:ABC-type hemin transport system ATPase subunit